MGHNFNQFGMEIFPEFAYLIWFALKQTDMLLTQNRFPRMPPKVSNLFLIAKTTENYLPNASQGKGIMHHEWEKRGNHSP